MMPNTRFVLAACAIHDVSATVRIAGVHELRQKTVVLMSAQTRTMRDEYDLGGADAGRVAAWT